MEAFDPATGKLLPAEAIQRILFIASSVHVYNIPPLASTKGYTAATWTDDPRRHIFTARLRVIETAVPAPSGGTEDEVKTDIVLEDPATGQLFAAAPYASAAAVEPALDSSRFFALRVQDPAGRKAILGIGFEERGDSFDFGVALQEARKALGLLDSHAYASSASGPASKAPTPSASSSGDEVHRDYSLKDGETITVNLAGTKLGGRAAHSRPDEQQSPSPASLNSFALAPPPPPASESPGSFSLPPPPGAPSNKSRRPVSGAWGGVVSSERKQTAADFGFDDGQFGEFA